MSSVIKSEGTRTTETLGKIADPKRAYLELNLLLNLSYGGGVVSVEAVPLLFLVACGIHYLAISRDPRDPIYALEQVAAYPAFS